MLCGSMATYAIVALRLPVFVQLSIHECINHLERSSRREYTIRVPCVRLCIQFVKALLVY